MRWGSTRVPALALVVLASLLALSLPAAAAGRKIFITKYDENFQGQAGVTFELYKDNPPVGGARGPEDTLVQSAVTDSAGAATFTDVALGDYWIHEVTPSGYVDNADQSVKVKKKGKLEFVFSNTPKPSNTRVNDPTEDASYGDGTHVFDFGPSLASDGSGAVMVAWNHSAGFLSPGDVSGVQTALSTNGGATWRDGVKMPTGSASTIVGSEPAVAYDPVRDRWVIAADAVTNTGSGLEYPIMVSTTQGVTGAWGPPVNAFPDIPPDTAFAHGPDLVVDPANGDIDLFFILSYGDGASEAMVTRSTDGGGTWGAVRSVFASGEHLDFVDAMVDADGRRHVVAGDHDDDFMDLVYALAVDENGLPYARRAIVRDVPRSGTPGQCTDSSVRTVFGSLAALDAPKVATSPLDPDRVYIVFPQHGQGADESDVMVAGSTDGGESWSAPRRVGPADGRAQFSPAVSVTPDGRIGVTYLEADAAGTAYDVMMTRADVYRQVQEQLWEELPTVPLMTGSPFWTTDPSFDSHYSNCFGLPPIASIAPGSGFIAAWADGRDPGPAGNAGVDPNIYVASTEGPPLPTTLTASVKKTETKLKPKGKLEPPPVPGGTVTVTLLRDTGDGFEKVGRKRVTTGASGSWSTSFPRPDGGRCRIVASFGGAEGRAPSVPVTKTFAC
jgi:hypothetical protein